MRRGEFAQKERELMKRIETEIMLFKYKTLAKSNIEIYDSCNIIRFYHCIYEYFIYAENLREDYVLACLKEENIIARLYELYLEREYLKCDTWDGIEEILNAFIYNT